MFQNISLKYLRVRQNDSFPLSEKIKAKGIEVVVYEPVLKEQYLNKAGYITFLCNSGEGSERECCYMEELVARFVDGLLIRENTMKAVNENLFNIFLVPPFISYR